MNYWLGIDCGGTFIKASLYDKQGNEYASARYSLNVISEHPGWAERDMAELWQECSKVISEVIRMAFKQHKISPSQIKGLGISAQGKGLFLLDKNKKPLGRGILSSDQRALNIVKQWQSDELPQTLYPKTRQTLWTGHPVSLLAWIKQHEPQRYAEIGSILMTHDYLRFCLTGDIFCEETNISESNLYNMDSGRYDPLLASQLGISEIMTALPPIIGASEIAGYISEQASLETGLIKGTPVIGGLFDVVSTAICSGLKDESQLNVVLGTWSVVSGITDMIDHNQEISFVYGRYAQKNQFIVHEASPTSAGNLEWFLQQWGNLDYAEINKLVEELPKASSSVFFIPFLYGSNAGLGMQAGFYGMQSMHTQAHLLQAIYEGVIFSLMTHLERMLIRFPNTKVLKVTGGPSKSQVWMQMLADMSGINIEVSNIGETGCLGAALMAMVGSGIYQDCATAQKILDSSITSIKPNMVIHQKYLKKYRNYQLLIENLKNFNHIKLI